MHPMDAIDYLRRIPFAVASVSELCTSPGSYAREVSQRVYQSVRADIEKAIALIEQEKKEKK